MLASAVPVLAIAAGAGLGLSLLVDAEEVLFVAGLAADNLRHFRLLWLVALFHLTYLLYIL